MFTHLHQCLMEDFKSIFSCSAQFAWTAVIRAAANGHFDCLRMLVDAGADKEAKTNVRAINYII